MTAPGAARLARYWVARYGAYPVIWFTAQEFDMNGLAYEPLWREAARAIAESDGYHHPITGHYFGTATGRNVTYWGEEPWHSFFMLQNGHARQNRVDFYREYWNLNPNYSLISRSVKPSAGEWEIPAKPDEQDWLLLVKDSRAGSNR